MTTPLPGIADPPRSVFAGTDVCSEAGFTLPPQAPRPLFDDDVWDFTAVTGLPVQMAVALRRFDFTAITNPRWQLAAKELIFALLTPRHHAVAPLPRANRNPLHLNTASGRLIELTRFLNWLTQQGITALGDIDTRCCEAYLAHRRYVLDEDGTVAGELSPATRRSAAQTVIDLVNYRELLSADRVAAALRPWGGAAASAIAEMPSGRTMNKTAPLKDDVLQPMLAAALYLVSTIGPPTAVLNRQIRQADQRWAKNSTTGFAHSNRVPAAAFTALLRRHERNGEPLPLLPGHHVQDRIDNGWSPEDPLVPIALNLMARQAGVTQFRHHWLRDLRGPIEATLGVVGAEKCFARDGVHVERADGQGSLAWSLPRHRLEAVALVGVVRTAAAAVVSAVSGMRSSELMELQAGCRRPPEEYGPGLVRYRLASKVIKGQPLGGTRDEWVVIEPAYQAVELAEQLHEDPRPGELLFGRFAFNIRYQWFRNWVNGPSGQRLGLAPIPASPVNQRVLRRTLAVELAYRPGGVLATKIHLNMSPSRQLRATLPAPAEPRPSCWLRSTSTKPSATSTGCSPSSATTSRASCPPAPAPVNSPASSPTSTPSSRQPALEPPRCSAVTGRPSTCWPSAPRSCTSGRRTTAGSLTRPGRCA
jgi:hypothetical protein